MVDKRATKSKSSDARRLRVKVELYGKDATKPFAVKGDELDEGVLSKEAVEYLLSSNQAEWVEGEQ